MDVMCWQQNQRNEVRLMGNKAGAVCTQPGVHCQNYLVVENIVGGGTNLLCLNDQGGSVMEVSDKAATLRAQDHGHPPVVCFEPGIMSRDCSAGNRAYMNVCSTLRAQMGDNQPAVCYENDY